VFILSSSPLFEKKGCRPEIVSRKAASGTVGAEGFFVVLYATDLQESSVDRLALAEGTRFELARQSLTISKVERKGSKTHVYADGESAQYFSTKLLKEVAFFDSDGQKIKANNGGSQIL
jgi:hypothetical protein